MLTGGWWEDKALARFLEQVFGAEEGREVHRGRFATEAKGMKVRTMRSGDSSYRGGGHQMSRRKQAAICLAQKMVGRSRRMASLRLRATKEWKTAWATNRINHRARMEVAWW